LLKYPPAKSKNFISLFAESATTILLLNIFTPSGKFKFVSPYPKPPNEKIKEGTGKVTTS